MLLYLKIALIMTFGGPSPDDAINMAPANLRDEAAALVYIESRGNSMARSGRHIGILQMRLTYVRDVSGQDGQWAILPWRNDLAIDLFVRANTKYKTLRSACPQVAVAVLHKGGPGTLKTFNKAMSSGSSWREALKMASKLHRIPRLHEFVRRFNSRLRRKKACLNA